LQLYDFGGLATVSNPPSLPVVPLSMPVIGTVALCIGANGADAYYDFSQDASANVPALPSTDGFTFDDVAGGQVIYDYDSSSATLQDVFVVGATRTQGPPTAAVLEIDPNDTSNSSYVSGNLHWLSLTTPRLGAAAAWTGEELVVIGGNSGATGASLPAGAEQIVPSSTTTTFTAMPAFPYDPSIGAGAVAQNTQSVVVAGGILPTGQDAGVRYFDVSCASSSSCITSWGSLPIPLTSASTFQLSNGGTYQFLVVGSELTSGLTHTFLLSSTGAKELPTKVPHYNAAAIESPIGFGSIVLFGGTDEIEQLMPPQTPP